MREEDVIHGGEPFMKALRTLIPEHKPNGAFIYGTC